MLAVLGTWHCVGLTHFYVIQCPIPLRRMKTCLTWRCVWYEWGTRTLKVWETLI